MSSVVLFNYKDFNSKIEVRSLANDIASKVVEAQKNALSGKLSSTGHDPFVSSWKPSYGLYFKTGINNNVNVGTNFVYFADLYNVGYCDPSCDTLSGSMDYLDTINISKGDYISKIEVFYAQGGNSQEVPNLSLVFTRSSSGMSVATYTGVNPNLLSGVNYVLVTVSSPSLVTSKIEIYPSGRIQIK